MDPLTNNTLLKSDDELTILLRCFGRVGDGDLVWDVTGEFIEAIPGVTTEEDGPIYSTSYCGNEANLILTSRNNFEGSLVCRSMESGAFAAIHFSSCKLWIVGSMQLLIRNV